MVAAFGDDTKNGCLGDWALLRTGILLITTPSDIKVMLHGTIFKRRFLTQHSVACGQLQIVATIIINMFQTSRSTAQTSYTVIDVMA